MKRAWWVVVALAAWSAACTGQVDAPGGDPPPMMGEDDPCEARADGAHCQGDERITCAAGELSTSQACAQGCQAGECVESMSQMSPDMDTPVTTAPKMCSWSGVSLSPDREWCTPDGQIIWCDGETGQWSDTGRTCEEAPARSDCAVSGETIPADTDWCSPQGQLQRCDGGTGQLQDLGQACGEEPSNNTMAGNQDPGEDPEPSRDGVSPRPPYTVNSCQSFGQSFTQIPVIKQTDRHPPSHAGMNMDWRGWVAFDEALEFVAYNPDQWGVDANAPKLHTLFDPARVPQFLQNYRAGHWDWGCADNGKDPQSGIDIGCRGPWIDGPLRSSGLGVRTTPGEVLRLPFRQPEVAASGERALVTYVGDDQISFTYTAEDGPFGYAVHIIGVCVDPSLRQALDMNFGRAALPGLKNGQPFGVARGEEVIIFIRDQGSFMDPRAEPDWWQGHP